MREAFRCRWHCGRDLREPGVLLSNRSVCVRPALGLQQGKAGSIQGQGGGGICLFIPGPMGGGPGVLPLSSQDAGPTQGLPLSARPLGGGGQPSPLPHPQDGGCPCEQRPGIARIGSGFGGELSWQLLT